MAGLYIAVMGRLISLLQLADAEEFIDGAFAGNLGEILIRCNNVMYMREAVSA